MYRRVTPMPLKTSIGVCTCSSEDDKGEPVNRQILNGLQRVPGMKSFFARDDSGILHNSAGERTIGSRAIAYFVLACTVIALASGCKQVQSAPVMAPPNVLVAPVIEREITEWDEFTGRLDAVQKVEVRPRVSGYIDQVTFTEGKMVKHGELLFQIDPRPYEAELHRAQAEEERVEARAKLAQQEIDRAEKMLAKRAISQEEVDERRNALQESQAGIAAAKAAVDQAALNLEFTHITSPIDGQVSRTEITRGNLVVGGQNTPAATLLTTVVSLDPIYSYFEADEQSYLKYCALARDGKLKSSRDVKNPIYMGLANEKGYPHPGYIDFLDNQVNAATGTIRARAVFANKDHMYTPGLFARLRVVGSGKYKAILVRDEAIGTDQDKKFVLRVGTNSTVQYQVVELGPLVDGLRIVREGLKPGDQIVVTGVMRVRPGISITAEKTVMEDNSAPAIPASGR
jgi:RND family efflux transporter MFP subunit